MNDFFKSIERGFGFAIGFFILAGLVLGVYAFVEPTSGPSVDYYINPNSSVANNNNYLGANKVPSGAFPDDYIEVCFKDGTTYYDTKTGGTTTSGGNCEPGDTGFVIDQDRTASGNFMTAIEACLQKGMRLQTVFEYAIACDNSATWGFTRYDSQEEWADATGLIATHGSRSQTRIATITYRSAGGGCLFSNSDEYMLGSSPSTNQYRCAK